MGSGAWRTEVEDRHRLARRAGREPRSVEIDLNPIVIVDGKPVVVDALFVT